MASQLQHTQQTQQTQESNEYSMYDQSLDVNLFLARFLSTCNNDRFETALIPIREPGHVFTFGRHKTCDFILDGSRFSNIHFKVWQVTHEGTESRYGDKRRILMVQDCSTNGTFLNQARIGKGQTTVLTNGDELAAGIGVTRDEVRYVVQLPLQSPPDMEHLSPEAAACVQKYDIRHVLGKGAFATVRCALDRNTGSQYAVKILNQRKLAITNQSSKATELFKREIEILQATKHPNVVQYVDMWADDTEIYLVLEFVPGGDLMDYIMKNTRLPEFESTQIVRQILDALIYCHSIGIAHRDIKPENILLTLDKPPIAKLTDFGLAKMVEPGSFLKTFCGTLTYVAPEVISMHGRIEGAYSTAVDMWSVGCVTFIMLAGCMPFAAEGQEAMMQVIQDCEYDEAILEEIELSGSGMDFIESLLRVDPKSRMSGKEASQHPWVKNALHDLREREMYEGERMDHDSQVHAPKRLQDALSGTSNGARMGANDSGAFRFDETNRNGYGMVHDDSVDWSTAKMANNGQANFDSSQDSSSNFLGSSQYVSAASRVANDSNVTITPIRLRQDQQKGNWFGRDKAYQSEPAYTR